MQNYIQDLFSVKIPKGKSSPNGWISHNCVCCVHNGQTKPDNRGRGGLKLDADGSLLLNCFNCKFTASWKPGSLLSNKIRNALKWLGASSQEINKANFEALKIKEDPEFIQLLQDKAEFNYDKIQLPEDSKKLDEWASAEIIDERFLAVLEYICKRNPNYINWFKDFYWSPTLPGRIIIPMLHKGVVYGWTARLVREPKNKYELRYELSKGTKFIFGADNLFKKYRKYVIMCEGPFDAIVVDGVASMGSTLSEHQLSWINSTDKEIILVPDKDKSGQALIDVAIENGWSVSFPDFGTNVKDVAEAANKYGRLMTTKLIIDSKEQNPLKINLIRKSWK